MTTRPMTPERRGYVMAMIAVAKDFPDGAFMGFMAECGIDVEELAALRARTTSDSDSGPTREGGV